MCTYCDIAAEPIGDCLDLPVDPEAGPSDPWRAWVDAEIAIERRVDAGELVEVLNS